MCDPLAFLETTGNRIPAVTGVQARNGKLDRTAVPARCDMLLVRLRSMDGLEELDRTLTARAFALETSELLNLLGLERFSLHKNDYRMALRWVYIYNILIKHIH